MSALIAKCVIGFICVSTQSGGVLVVPLCPKYQTVKVINEYGFECVDIQDERTEDGNSLAFKYHY